MTGDHHSPAVGAATLLLTVTDGTPGTHNGVMSAASCTVLGSTETSLLTSVATFGSLLILACQALNTATSRPVRPPPDPAHPMAPRLCGAATRGRPRPGRNAAGRPAWPDASAASAVGQARAGGRGAYPATRRGRALPGLWRRHRPGRVAARSGRALCGADSARPAGGHRLPGGLDELGSVTELA